MRDSASSSSAIPLVIGAVIVIVVLTVVIAWVPMVVCPVSEYHRGRKEGRPGPCTLCNDTGKTTWRKKWKEEKSARVLAQLIRASREFDGEQSRFGKRIDSR